MLKISAFILITIIIQLEITHQQQQKPPKSTALCQIFNEFHRVYIYAHFKFFGLGKYRRVRLEYVFRGSMNYSDYDAAGVWSFEPITTRLDATQSRKSTFLIRNRKYPEEYLRGSNFYQEWFYKTNRAPVVEKMTANRTVDDENVDEDMFEWEFRLVTNRSQLQHQRFYIFNRKLGLPLYARKYDSIWKPQYYKMVSIFNSAQTNSEEFEWTLKCRDDRNPVLERL